MPRKKVSSMGRRAALFLLAGTALAFTIFAPTGSFAQKPALKANPSIPEISSGAAALDLRQLADPAAIGPFHDRADKAPLFPGAAFDAYNFDDNAALNGGFLFIPPDPIGAAGLDRVIAVVNCGIECRDKTGTLLFRSSLQNLFAPAIPLGALGTSTFDPKIVYDPYEDRFVVVALERQFLSSGDPGDNSRILLAVSKTSAPVTATAADWWYYVIDSKLIVGGLAAWADYPGFEVDEEAIYVTANMFAFSGSTYGVRLWIVPKFPFYLGGGGSHTVHDPYAGAGLSGFETTTMPAQVTGAGGVGPGIGTFLASYSGLTYGGAAAPEALIVIRVDNPLGATSFLGEFITMADIEDVGGAFGWPALPDAPQAGGSALIEVNDRRMLDLEWRNGRIWGCTTIIPNATFDPANAGQTTAHWFELDAMGVISSASPAGLITVAQQGDAGGEDLDPDSYTFFPSIAVNPAGEMKLGFAGSSPTTYGSAYLAGRIPGEPAGFVGPTGIARAGVDYYLRTFGGSRNRWGDYSGISVDPADPTKFWIFNQYSALRGTPISGEDGRWGTAWLECSFAPPVQPDLIVRVLDGPCCTFRGDVLGPDVLCRITNIGSGAAGGFHVGLYISADGIITTGDDLLVGGREFVPGLAAGATVIVPFPSATVSPIAPLGNVFLGAIADDTANVAESDETNNTAARGILVNNGIEECTEIMASTAATIRVSVFNVPNGSGDPLAAAQTFAGPPINATITVKATDCGGNPVPGLRPILGTTLGGLTSCPAGGTKSDAPTNAAGVALFTKPLFAGGYTDPVNGELTHVLGQSYPFAEVLYGNKDMFASDQQGNIYRVSLATGAAALVCNLNGPFSTEIEYNPATGRSYAQGIDGSFLGREFNMFSCAQLAPDVTTSSSHNGLEWIGGSLYSTNILTTCGNSMFSVLNPATGAQFDIGPTGFGPINGLAWDPCCRKLYGSTGCTSTFGPTELVAIDITTGAATAIGNTGVQLGSIEFGADNTLYGGGGQADGANLYTIDTNTGAVNLVGPTGMIGVTGLALVSDVGLDIQFNSADINGDLIVNLSDLGVFTTDYFGSYRYRSDFAWDGMVNLSDLGRFASAYGAGCPAIIPAKLANVASAGEIGLYFDPAGTQRTLAAEPNTTVTAYLIMRGQAAQAGVSAFEYQIKTSSNLAVEEWIFGEQALNFGSEGDVIVGLGNAKKAPAGESLQLAQVRLRATNDQPARIDLLAGSKPSLDGDRPVVLAGGTLSPVDVKTLANGAAAAINDDALEAEGPQAFAGVQLRNSPNPFNPATAIKFNLPKAGMAEVRIYDVSGRVVRTLGGTMLNQGANSFPWNGTDNRQARVGSGVYFYRLFLDGDPLGSPVKMTLLK